MKLKIFRITVILLTVIWMVTIFGFSSQNANTSAKLSNGIKYKIFCAVYPDFEEMSAEQQQEILNKFPIRKLAHFSSYFLLGILSWLSFITYKKIPFKIRFLLSYSVCVLYAFSDEFHQLFIDGRSGEFKDVLIDSSGALLAIVIFTLIARFSKRIYSIIKYEEC